MAIIYKELEYMGNTLESLGLMCVDFDEETEIPLGLQKTIEKGETNRYRIKSNHIYTLYNDTLEFQIDVVKSICDTCNDQTKMKYTKSEIREITKQLSSTTIPQLLKTVDENDEVLYYCGIFTNIESFAVAGEVYGFTLTFTNDSPFAYSDIKTTSFYLNGNTTKTITNNSDLLDDYIYPVVHLYPKSNTDFYMCNLSDSKVLTSGKITIASDSNTTLNNFLNAIDSFATNNRYTVEYYYDSDGYTKTWAKNTALRIMLKESDNTEHYGFAYYLNDGTYKIIECGFVTLKLYSDLDIEINCELLTIRDSIDRMVHFKNIGIDEEDYIYWLRLISGNNTLLFYGTDCDVKIEYREMLKVGAA